ncbi:class I SAM-dependent methyltransferase [Algoriella sp.]|uniref:class I SAM-dependent methyltransferase n=1 Tax=Algoriella sp. TaxID=1872434 RepID=UPI002FC6C50A
MMNYNFIAPYYHSLSQLIFLNQQHRAHFPILNFLKAGDKILWVGGGAGKFILELEKLNFNLEITYIDFSSKMIDLARKQSTKNIKINFIISDIFDFETSEKYDVIMTTFLFDHFHQSKAEELFMKLNNFMNTDGIWFYVDFTQNQKAWQKTLTKLMLQFFRIIIGLDISRLPKMNQLFEKDYDVINQQQFFRKYIESSIYKKK